MATNAVKVFPRGYSGGQSRNQSNFTNRGGDAEMSELWAVYSAPNNQSTGWSFRKRVLKTAKRLLTDNSNWFIAQDKNPNVVEYNYQFVVDTLRFIGTGRRQININAWGDLVSHAPTGGLKGVSERHEIADIFRTLQLTTSVDALIQLWCSHPKGFDDLINSINILFGDISVSEPRHFSGLANSWREQDEKRLNNQRLAR